MKISGFILGALFVAASANVNADIKLNLSEGISMLALNGVEASSDSGYVMLPDGQNQIVVKYAAEIKTSADDYELESTEAFVLRFEASKTDMSLSVPVIRSMRDLERFENSAAWGLSDATGSAIEFQSAALVKEGFQLARDYERELIEFNQTNSPAALKTQKSTYSAFYGNQPVKKPVNNSVEQAGEEAANMPEEMLKYWYNQADSETRKRFKAWLAQ